MGTKRFSRKQNFNKTNIKNTPEDKPIVYELLDNSGKNIYTGISKRGQGAERLADHLSGGTHPIPGAQTFRTKQKRSIADARAEERKKIKDEDPKHNKRA